MRQVQFDSIIHHARVATCLGSYDVRRRPVYTYECPERQIGKEQPGDAANDNTNKHRRCEMSEYKLSLCEAKEHIL